MQESLHLRQQSKENDLKLRQTMQNMLIKLNNQDTRNKGIKEIFMYISSNCTPKILRLWLSILSDINQSNEFIIIIYGYLASVYKKNLIDPIDSSPHIAKTILRVINQIQNHFVTDNQRIQKACSKTWCELYLSCIYDENLEIKKLLMIEPLHSIICGGTNIASQITCLFILNDLIDAIYKINDNDSLLLVIFNKFLGFFMKNSLEHPLIISILTKLMKFIDLEDFSFALEELIHKTFYYLDEKTKSRFPIYIFKINSCELLKVLASKLLKRTEYIIGTYYKLVIDELEKSTKDKLIKVQIAARESLLEWKKVEEIYSQIEKAKSSQNKNGGLTYKNLIFEKNKNIVEHLDNNNKQIKEIFEKEGGWIAETNGKNFIKRKTGTGGGHIILDAEKIKKPNNCKINIVNNLNKILSSKSPNHSEENLVSLQEIYSKKDLNINPIRSEENLNSLQEIYSKKNIYISSPELNNIETAEKMSEIEELENSISDQLNETVKYDSPENSLISDTIEFVSRKEIESSNKIENKEVNNINSNDSILNYEEKMSEIWNNALIDLNNNDLDTAYKRIIDSNDDIYLMRLMMKTGSCLKKLRRNTAINLIKKISLITQNNFVNKIWIKFFQEIFKEKTINDLSIENQNKIMEILYKLNKETGVVKEKSNEMIKILNDKLKN